jgi:S1-C subfamily serine protease
MPLVMRWVRLVCCGISVAGFFQIQAAEPVMVCGKAVFEANGGGRICESSAMPVGDGTMFVAVALPGSDVNRVSLMYGGRTLSVQLTGQDPVSRLCLLKSETRAVFVPAVADSASGAARMVMQVKPGGGSPFRARATGWVKQVGGRILPLALMRVNYDRAVPLPGEPIYDEAGRVVALAFQAGDVPNAGFALPIDVLHRVLNDLQKGGRPVRAWLGLSLRADAPSPQITGVWKDSPASRAGLRVRDVLLDVDGGAVADYADAVNAFYYLRPGRPLKIRVLRGVEEIGVEMTPVAAPAGDVPALP